MISNKIELGPEEPKETLVNFPQSIMSGVTKEGGLVSLTFKSIKTADLVENLDMMRQSLIRPTDEFLPTRISSDKFDPEQIKSRIDRAAQPIEYVSETNEISSLHQKLQNNDAEVGDILARKVESNSSKRLVVAETKISTVSYNIDVDVAPDQ
ncbi:hypothetical protein JA9_000665 [Meyerozyma sp. JA9]|nr:hypothetical protein JA9_000665 [Meyerozyma sp. JA9]